MWHIIEEDRHIKQCHHGEVGGAGGESLSPAVLWLDLQEEEEDDVEVGEEHDDEGTQSNGPSDDVEEAQVEAGAAAGQAQQGLDVTEKVVDTVAATEVQSGGHDHVQQGM